jgi:hypothetical protein
LYLRVYKQQARQNRPSPPGDIHRAGRAFLAGTDFGGHTPPHRADVSPMPGVASAAGHGLRKYLSAVSPFIPFLTRLSSHGARRIYTPGKLRSKTY